MIPEIPSHRDMKVEDRKKSVMVSACSSRLEFVLVVGARKMPGTDDRGGSLDCSRLRRCVEDDGRGLWLRVVVDMLIWLSYLKVELLPR